MKQKNTRHKKRNNQCYKPINFNIKYPKEEFCLPTSHVFLQSSLGLPYAYSSVYEDFLCF